VSYTTRSPAAAHALLSSSDLDFTIDQGGTGDAGPALPGARQAPLAVTATTVAVAATDTATRQPVTGLHVDAPVLAALYTGHPAAAAARLQTLNPAAHLPARLVGLTVTADVDQTRRLTRWLASASPASWPAGTVDQLPSSPPPAGVQAVADDATLTGLLHHPPAAGATYLAYLDVTTATADALTPAALPAPGGEFLIPTPAALTAGAAAGTAGAGSLAAGAYPLAGLDLLTVAGAPRPAVARALAGLLDYAAGPGQSLLPAGVPPLPATLAAQTRALAAQLQPPAAPPVTATPAAATPGPLPQPAPAVQRPAPVVPARPAQAPAFPAAPGPVSTWAGPRPTPIDRAGSQVGSASGRPVTTVPAAPTPPLHVPGPAPLSGRWMPASLGPVADQLALNPPVSPPAPAAGVLAAPEPPQLAPELTTASSPPPSGPVRLASRSTAPRRSSALSAVLVCLLVVVFAAAASPGRSRRSAPTSLGP